MTSGQVARAPLDGLPFLCAGTSPLLDEAGRLLEALGADVVRVPVLHGPEHARRVAVVEPIGALDVTGLLVAEVRPPFPVVEPALGDPLEAWAASGALALTGSPNQAPIEVDPIVPTRVLAAGAVVQLLAACREVALDLDPLALLAERAAITGFVRQGTTSVGGSCRLVRAADGWVALNLARPEDLDALPALLDAEVEAGAPWPEIAAAIARRARVALVERATLLGVPLSAVPEPGELAAPRSPYLVGSPGEPSSDGPRAGLADRGTPRSVGRLRPMSTPSVRPAPRDALVVDLSSLWAGPLAASLLGRTGARVVKVESRTRPDGGRRGPAAFYDLVNEGKESVALDFTDPADLALLHALVAAADIVIEGSRPRALEALGVEAAGVVAGGATTWISITGHGRHGVDAQRVGFGDDAAAAGGLVVGDPPCFVADAAADPITGLYAAAAGLAALVGRRGQVIDVALARSAAYVAAGASRVQRATTRRVAAPRSRPAVRPASPLGAHTGAWRITLGGR